MKLYFFLLICLTADSTRINAQQVFRFRATESCVSKATEDTCEWVNSSTLIVLNTGNKTITLYTPKAISFAYVSSEIVNLNQKEKQDTKLRTWYEAIDGDGNKCKIMVNVMTETNGHLVLIKIISKEYKVSYITDHIE